jgi:hypothetical protein
MTSAPPPPRPREQPATPWFKRADVMIHITLPSTANARAYWRERSVIDHTDWESVGLVAARAMWRLGLTSSVCWGSSCR